MNPGQMRLDTAILVHQQRNWIPGTSLPQAHRSIQCQSTTKIPGRSETVGGLKV